MSTLREERDARMYDEHRPPQPGIEREIMEVLKEEGEISPRELLDIMENKRFSKSETREHVWLLIDRGYIELTVDREFKGRAEPVSPAPVDLS